MVSMVNEGLYQVTIEEIKRSFGRVPGFMNFIPKDKIASDWPAWKEVGEIYLERASCLLCTDSLAEEIL